MDLLRVQGLRTCFFDGNNETKAVDDITFNLGYKEILGLVGESGAGKTLTGRSVIRLIPPTGRIVAGKILFKGRNLLDLSEDEMQKIRGKEISVIQQDPLSSLNPSFKIKDQMIDVLRLHLGLRGDEAYSKVIQLLRQVGISDAIGTMNKYPHQLSGGMCQRVMIAVAFSCEPSLVIADEPTTALDVITQLQIIDLMKMVQDKHNTSIIFVTHNMGLASKICDRVSVMYAGKIAELAPVSKIFQSPKHPYTKALLKTIPRYDVKARILYSIKGSMPNPAYLPSGCSFHPRCDEAMKTCYDVVPMLTNVGEEHFVSCLLFPECRGRR